MREKEKEKQRYRITVGVHAGKLYNEYLAKVSDCLGKSVTYGHLMSYSGAVIKKISGNSAIQFIDSKSKIKRNDKRKIWKVKCKLMTNIPTFGSQPK